MKALFTKRGAGLCCILLLALFLFRPGAGPLRGKISSSMGQALGKRVEIGNVHLRLFPRIGFELGDVVIHDDPEFGAEPLLRSPDVTAWLRVTSLLRGRLEISSLSLKDASVNLTRSIQGKWNLQDLIERTRNSAAAPTASKQNRPEFPYIEADDARINFKIGWEKTHFALTDSDFALWQDSENTWGMRLRARPIRTDANLTDTGVVELSGTWQRALSLGTTPVQFSFRWKQAQVGQMSKLAYGADQGWRGDAQVSAALSGTPEKLAVTLDGAIDDFRRFDVLGGGDLRLALHCGAEYNSGPRVLSNLDCTTPGGNGSLELKGSASALWPPAYSISVLAAKFPAHSLLGFIRHMHGSVPTELDATGDVNATLSLRRGPSAQPGITGEGEINNLRLTSGSDQALIRVERAPFAITRTTKSGRGSDPIDVLEIGPVTMAMGRNTPLEVRALLSRSGYDLAVIGDASIRPFLRAARALSLAVPAISADGNSTVNLALSGNWSGPQSRPVGTAQLRNVTAQVRGLNKPVRIETAKLLLLPNLVHVQNLKVSAAAAEWMGSMEIPRPCGIPHDCNFQFNLRSDRVDASGMNALLNPRARKQSWYKLFTGSAAPASFLLQARASGRISIGSLRLGNVTYNKVSADLELDNGRVQLKNAHGGLLDGILSGTLNADFRAKPPLYSGTGSLESVSLGQLAELMHNGWVSGSGGANYEFKASGSSLQDLIDSADVRATFAVEDGDLPHVVLTSESGPLQMNQFRGLLLLKKRRFSLNDAKLTTPSGVFTVSGTASLAGDLNFKLSAENAPSYSVSGSLLKMNVSAIPPSPTQASLKP